MDKINLYGILRRQEKREIITMYENGESNYAISHKTRKPVIEIKIIIYKYEKKKARKLIQRNKAPEYSLSKSDLEIIIGEALIKNIELIHEMIPTELIQEMDDIANRLIEAKVKLYTKRINKQEQEYLIRKMFRSLNRIIDMKEFLEML